MEDGKALTEESVELAGQFGRYGCRRISALLKHRGWHVNHKRVERIWRREGLKLPVKQPQRGRLWSDDGSCVRLRPAWKNHVWAYDSVVVAIDSSPTPQRQGYLYTHSNPYRDCYPYQPLYD